MKKIFPLVLALLLVGCSATPTSESIKDSNSQPSITNPCNEPSTSISDSTTLPSISEDDPSISEPSEEIIHWTEKLPAPVNKTLRESLDLIYDLPLSDKGSSYSSNFESGTKREITFVDDKSIVVTLTATVYQKVQDKNFYLMDDDNNILQGYAIDNNRINNSLTQGNKYEITGILTMYKYKPTLMLYKTYEQENESPSLVSLGISTLNPFAKAQDKSVAGIRRLSADTKTTYETMYKFTGYLNLDDKDQDKYQLCLVDSALDNADAFKPDFKAIRIYNYQNLDVVDKLTDLYLNETLLTICFSIHDIINVNKQPVYRAYVYLDTLTV